MTDDELYEAFEKAFPEAEDYAKTYAHMPLDRYKAPYDGMFEGFDAGVRVVEERITALEERLELWAEDGEGNKVKLEIGDSDGIGCRDETIDMLDEKLQQIRPENLAARTALAEKYAAQYDGDDRQDIKTDILNAIYWAWRAK